MKKLLIASIIAFMLGHTAANAADSVMIVGNNKCSVCYVKKVQSKKGRMTIKMLGDRCFKPLKSCEFLKPLKKNKIGKS